jgi:hypothetical protein
MITTQSPPSPHKRHDLGVIVRWEIHVKGNIFVAEQFRGYFKCSSCSRRSCEHVRLAEQLEQVWQLNDTTEKPGNCFFCGRLCRSRNGLAICAKCAL